MFCSERGAQLIDNYRVVYYRVRKMSHIQILNATDRQAIDSQMTGAIVKREDGPLAEPPAALDL